MTLVLLSVTATVSSVNGIKQVSGFSVGSQVGAVCSTSQVLHHGLQPLALSTYLRSSQPTGGVLRLSFPPSSNYL